MITGPKLSDVKQLVFEVREFCSQVGIPHRVLAASTLSRYEDPLAMHVRYMIKTHIYSMVRNVAVTVPASRWDAVKDLFVPRWARRWLPVRYRDLSAEALALLPDEVVHGRFSDRIRVAIHEGLPILWTDNGKEQS